MVSEEQLNQMSIEELLILKNNLIEEKLLEAMTISEEAYSRFYTQYLLCIEERERLIAKKKMKDLLTNNYTLRELKKLKKQLEMEVKKEQLFSCYNRASQFGFIFNNEERNTQNIDYEELLEVVNNVLSLRQKRK